MGVKERYEAKKTKSQTNSVRNKTESSSSGVKERYEAKKATKKLQNTINLDTLQTDLTTLSKTISSVYSGWQTQETMRNTLSSVQSMHERLSKYQDYYNKYGGTDLSELQSAYKSVLDGWDGLSTEYAKYKNADAFNASKKIALMDKDYSGLTYDEVQSKKKEYDENSFEYKYFDNYTKYKDLNEFDKAIEARKSNKSKPKTTLGSEEKTFNPDDFKLYETKKDKPTSLLDAVNTPKTEELFKPHEFTPESKEEYYQGLALKSRDLEAERNKWSLDHQFDLHKDVMQNEDFAENSKYVSTEGVYDNLWDKVNKGQYGLGYGDLVYEYINNVGGVRDKIKSRGESFSKDTANLGSLVSEKIWERGYDKLNPDEVSVYNYWHNYDKINGTNKAQEFLADMEITLDKRTYDEQTKRWETANENPILATLNSIASVPASVFGAIPTAVDAGLDAIQGKAYNPYSKAKALTNFAQDTREYVGDNIAEATKGAEFLGQNVPSFLYQTGMSLADNLMGASTLKNAYLPMMSTNAFHQKAKEMTEAGEDKATIYTTALASAAAEMVFEKISLDRFLKIKGVDSKISIITNTLKQAGVEASEEFFTEIANLISDDAIRGDDSELKKKYQDLLASGYSESEANTEIAKQIGSQVGWAAAGGGLSGGAMGFVGSLGNYSENKDRGETIKSNERVSDMLDLANNPEIGEAYEAYTRYANKGINAENISNAQLGNLYTSAKSGAVDTLGSRKTSIEQKRTASDTLDRLSVVDTENTVAKRAKELNVGEETKVTKSGENAKIEGIKVTKDGTSVVTNNGEVALDDITLSQNDSELVAYAEQITKEQGEDVGSLFISQYDGEMDMSEYGHSFNKVSLLSKYDSVTLDDIIEVKGELSATQATKIYNGVRAAFEKANKESTEKALEKMRNGMHKKGFVDDTIFDYDNASTVDSGRINWNDLNERQRASITFTKGLFSALGNRVVYVGKNKKFNGMYHIDGDTIFIDAYAGMDVVKGLGRDSIIPTASHELTHQMKMYSRETYNEVKEIVLDALTKVAQVTDKSITRGDIIRAELERLNEKHSDKEHSEEEAIDELIAKACEDMLSVSKEGVKLFNSLSEEEQKKLGDRIKDILAKLKNWINDLLKSYKSNSAEAQALRSMQDAFDEVSKRWDKMLVDIAEQNKARNESVSAESTETIDVNEVISIGSRDLGEFSEALDTDGNQMFQYRAMEEDKETYRAMLLKHKKVIGISAIQIEELFDTIDSAIDIISENLEALDYAWEADIDDRAFSPIKPNSDSLYKVSLDFSTLCRKRLLQQTIQATLQETLNKQLSKEEAIAIRDELMKVQEEGKQIEVACALCYVESARMKSPKQINKFLDNREAIIKEFFANRSGGSIKEKIKNAEMKARETLKKSYPDGMPGKNDTTLDVLTAPLNKMLKADAEYIRAKKKEAKYSYKLTEHEQAELESAKNMNVADFTSAKGLENLAKNHPDLFDAYTSFVRNATHSKGIENDVWWRAGDSEAIGDNLIAQMNAENGLRSQSWSDFQVIHLLDYIAATIELSTKGAKRQSYTKVPDYVRLLGNTGDMINMSVIPERAFSGKLGYDDVEGMAYKIAVELRQKYHNTAGIICIGMDDKQIRLLLADDTIDMVIPYHSSSMSKDTRKLMHIPAWKDYQAYQNEKKLSEEEAEARAKEYGVKLKKDDNYQNAPKFSEWFDLEEARQIAKMENANPSDKVAQKKYGVMYGGYKAMQNAADKYLKLCAERGIAPKFSHENADYTHEANYWKLLIDRKMVDNVTGEIIEQKAIKPIFDKNDVLGILNEELERYPQVKADQEYASRKVVQKFLSGDMKMDESTRKAIQTPIDNITEVNILESAEHIADEGKMMHSDRDSEGNTLTEAQQEYFKDSNVRDENGNLLVVYHGTKTGGFTVFDRTDDIGYFFTDSENNAGSYSGTYKQFTPKKYENWADLIKDSEDNGISITYDEEANTYFVTDGWYDSTFAENELEDACAEVMYLLYGSEGDFNEKMNYAGYLNITNPLIINGNGSNWDAVIDYYEGGEFVTYGELTEEQIQGFMDNGREEWELHDIVNEGGYSLPVYDVKNFEISYPMSTREWVQEATYGDYDGVIFKDILDSGSEFGSRSYESNVYVALKSNQFKSVENKKPTSHPDIRYSDRDSEESKSIKEQLVQNQDKLNSMDVIASVNITKDFKNKKEVLAWAIETLKQSGYKVDRQGFGVVVLDEKRIDNGLNYINTQPDYIAYALVPKVIKRGVVVGEHSNHKSRGYSTVTFGAPIEINGIRMNMAVVIRIENKNYYKLHRVLMPSGGLFEFKKESNAEPAAATTKVVDSPTDIASKDSIHESSKKVNTKISNDKTMNSDREEISVYDLMGEADRLSKENENLRADIERLNERLKIEKKVTHGNYFNENQLGAVAGHLRNISKSNMDKVELMKSLKDVYSFIAHSENLTWEDVLSKCYTIADKMIAESKPETVIDDYSKHILDDIRSKRISFSDAQKNEAQYIFGKNWNRNFFGKVTITDSGISLEDQWREWSDLYPSIFDANITDTDMPGALYDILGSLKEASEVVVEYDLAEKTRWLATEIYNQYWNVSPIRTTADKYDKQIKRLNFEHRNAMKELRDSYDTRLKEQQLADDIHYAGKLGKQEAKYEAELAERKARIEKQKELYKNLRDRKDKQIAEAKQKGRERLDKYKENAERKTYIQRITANALTLNTWLKKNSKDYHIHEAMKGPVIKLLNAIDFSSKSMLEKGEPTQRDASFVEAFAEVKSMLENADNMVEGLESLYGHDLAEDIEKLVKSTYHLMGDNNYVINAMSIEELHSLDKLVRHIKKVVTDLNRFHIVNHNQGAVNLADEFMEHGEKLGKLEKQHGTMGKFFEFRNRTPYYFFKDLGKVGEKLFEAFQDGWDKLAFNAKKIIDFTKEVYTDKEVQEWSKETKEFKLSQPDGSERTINMSIAQIMSLYCVSKQEDAQTHLLSGGMTLKRIDKKGHVITDYDNINLTYADIKSILDTLTDRQREVADKLQEFMNTVCSDWGNEISMARFGVKMFGLPDYFPIKVSEATVPTDNTKDIDNVSLWRLLNMSFTKARNKNAEQSIEIGDIFDIFAQHSSDMAKYNALALPVLDFNKFYSINYRDMNGKENGVVQTLKSVFGDEANRYLRTFIRDLNGSQNVSRDVIGNTFFKNAKVASVAANLRVVLLQPTAFHKASAVMDMKYLTKASAYIKLEPVGMVKKLKKAIDNAEKYCGIIQWKALGYYDTDISKGLTEKIKHSEGIKDKLIEKSLKGAELADKVTFGTLWVACEFEIRDTRKDLKVGSEEFYNAIAKRLRDIIYATQVVDSTMTRSDMMRSADGRDKMLTAFGSEPTIAYNMLLDLATQYKRDKQEFGNKEAKKKNSKKIRKVVTAYVITNAVAALVESGFDVFRDDDDEEMDMAEFLKLYFKNFAFDVSIGNKLPYIKELYSTLQGYSSSRMDTQWFQSVNYTIKDIKKIVEGEGDWSKFIKDFAKAMSYMSGLPFYNIFRDAMALLDKLGILDD